MMSLVQAAELNGRDPRVYFRNVLTRIHAHTRQRLTICFGIAGGRGRGFRPMTRARAGVPYFGPTRSFARMKKWPIFSGGTTTIGT